MQTEPVKRWKYGLALLAAVSTVGEEFISILGESVEELSKELPKLDILD